MNLQLKGEISAGVTSTGMAFNVMDWFIPTRESEGGGRAPQLSWGTAFFKGWIWKGICWEDGKAGPVIRKNPGHCRVFRAKGGNHLEKEGAVTFTSNAAEKSREIKREKCPKDLTIRTCAWPVHGQLQWGSGGKIHGRAGWRANSLPGKDGRVNTSVPPNTSWKLWSFFVCFLNTSPKGYRKSEGDSSKKQKQKQKQSFKTENHT